LVAGADIVNKELISLTFPQLEAYVSSVSSLLKMSKGMAAVQEQKNGRRSQCLPGNKETIHRVWQPIERKMYGMFGERTGYRGAKILRKQQREQWLWGRKKIGMYVHDILEETRMLNSKPCNLMDLNIITKHEQPYWEPSWYNNKILSHYVP